MKYIALALYWAFRILVVSLLWIFLLLWDLRPRSWKEYKTAILEEWFPDDGSDFYY